MVRTFSPLVKLPAIEPLAASRGGKAILFPASALGRKGAHALRAAISGLDVEVLVQGGAMESKGFWGDLPVRRAGQRFVFFHRELRLVRDG